MIPYKQVGYAINMVAFFKEQSMIVPSVKQKEEIHK
jgi:hypothetical protein